MVAEARKEAQAAIAEAKSSTQEEQNKKLAEVKAVSAPRCAPLIRLGHHVASRMVLMRTLICRKCLRGRAFTVQQMWCKPDVSTGPNTALTSCLL